MSDPSNKAPLQQAYGYKRASGALYGSDLQSPSLSPVRRGDVLCGAVNAKIYNPAKSAYAFEWKSALGAVSSVHTNNFTKALESGFELLIN